MKYVNAAGDPLNPVEVPDWESSVDKHATGKGWICRICSVLLAPSASLAVKHLAWHEANDGR